MEVLNKEKIITDVAELSRIYSSRPYNEKKLQTLVDTPYVDIICHYTDIENQDDLRAYAVLMPNLSAKFTKPLPDNAVSFAVNIDTWGRDFFFDDTELVSFFARCLCYWMCNFTDFLIKGKLAIDKAGEIRICSNPVPNDTLTIYGQWKIKVDPDDFDLLKALSEHDMLILADAKQITDTLMIVSGYLNHERILQWKNIT